jgi:hypothetical protein
VSDDFLDWDADQFPDGEPDECDHLEYEVDLLTGRAECDHCPHTWHLTDEQLNQEIVRQREAYEAFHAQADQDGQA